MSQKYKFFCDKCHFTKFTDGTDLDDMVIYKRSKIMTVAPKMTANKTIPAVMKALPNKFRCPQCNNLITAKKIHENNDSRSEASNAGSEVSPESPGNPAT